MLVERIHMQGKAHATVLDDVPLRSVCLMVDRADWTGWTYHAKGTLVNALTWQWIATEYDHATWL